MFASRMVTKERTEKRHDGSASEGERGGGRTGASQSLAVFPLEAAHKAGRKSKVGRGVRGSAGYWRLRNAT